MNRLTVYIIMASIVVVNAAIFGFIISNQAKALSTGLQHVNQGSPTKAVSQFFGDFENPLGRPMDVLVTDEFMYVTDTDNKKVHVFSVNGEQLFTFGEAGNNPGQFDFPYGISVDSEEKIYVADLYNAKISIFDKNGDFIDYFAEQYSNNGTIVSPAGLRIINETVYVTDVQRNKVFTFNLDGELLQEIGEPGVEEGMFFAPNAITADNDGNIYVVDTGNSRIQVFDNEGNFVRVIDGSIGESGNSVLVNPRGIGVNSKGVIYVVSNLTNFVHSFDNEGNELYRFGGIGQSTGQFQLPNGLFIDNRDTIYVTETINQRVSTFN